MRHPNPIISDHFGHWKVIGFVNKERGRQFIVCRCVCGVIRDIPPGNLRVGSRSCGCRGLAELICLGEQFNKWTVIELSKDANGALAAVCDCACGTRREVTRSALISGKSRSCGCQELVVLVVDKSYWRLTILELIAGAPGVRSTARCRCECGTLTTVTQDHLSSGHTRSCGCLAREARSLTGQKVGAVNGAKNGKLSKHGHTVNEKPSPTYVSWRAMLSRCRDTQDPNYGGRGVKITERWLGENGFANFLADMGPRLPNTTLDRFPDPNGPYCGKRDEKPNCRWATPTEQGRNKRKHRLVDFRGQQRILSELAEEFSISIQLLHRRLKKDWPIEHAVVKDATRYRLPGFEDPAGSSDAAWQQERSKKAQKSGSVNGAKNGKRIKHGHMRGGIQSPTYKSWSNMCQRCRDKTRAHYGRRGIKVCDRWLGENGFANFLADMKERPDNTTLDRHPDKNGDYELSNCRWATDKEQARNRRGNDEFEFNGRTQTNAAWAEEYGISPQLLRYRRRANWKLEDALNRSKSRYGRVEDLRNPAAPPSLVSVVNDNGSSADYNEVAKTCVNATEGDHASSYA